MGEKVCLQCGNGFTAKRVDATFCSDTCRKANSREEALKWSGVLIRGQHDGDVAVTGFGIIQDNCKCCGKEFSRWLESKMARLVRNEVEGSIHWGSRGEFDRVKFDELMAVRLREVKFCSDECMGKGEVVRELKRRPVVEKVDKSEGNGQEKAKERPKRRGQ